MDILKADRKTGEFRLRISNTDDLWHLKQILEVGDFVKGKTTRRMTIKTGSEVKKGDREVVVLGIDVEKIEIDSEVKLTGKIVEGSESVDRGYHTLRLKIGDDFTIRKTWKKHQIERIEKSKIKKPLLLICVLDRDEASVAGLKESGIEHFTDISAGYLEDDRSSYYKEVSDFLSEKTGYETIILAGPGFEKENMLEYLKKKNPGLAKRIILEQASYTGKAGIEEVLKRTANKILTDTRVSRESKYVEEFLKRIKTNDMVSYGKLSVEKAIDFGAVEMLITSVEKIGEFESLIRKTEEMKGVVIFINSDHSMGEQFLKFGGIGCFLRFRVE